MATWTRIHRCDQHKTGWECQTAVRAADGDGLVFHRLAHHFQHVAVELRQLVEEQHAAMRQADFARPRPVAPPNKSGIAVRVVTKSPSVRSSLCIRIYSSYTVSSFFSPQRSLKMQRKRRCRQRKKLSDLCALCGRRSSCSINVHPSASLGVSSSPFCQPRVSRPMRYSESPSLNSSGIPVAQSQVKVSTD